MAFVQRQGQLQSNPDGTFSVNAATGSDEPRFVSFSRSYLIVVNVAMCVLGLCLLGAGVFVFIEFNTKFSQLLSESAPIGAIVAGVLISFLACFGGYGALHTTPRILIAYALVALALMCAILSILGVFVQYIATVEQVAAGNLLVFNPKQVEVNDFFASAYTKCCVQNTLFCSSTIPSTEGFCKPVVYCSEKNSTSNNVTYTATEPCYTGYYGLTANNPPKLVYSEFCATLLAAGLVGPSTAVHQKCGYPLGASLFFAQVFGFVNAYVQYPYICISLLTIVLFTQAVFALVVVRHQWRVENGDYIGNDTAKALSKVDMMPQKKATDEFEASFDNGLSLANYVDDSGVGYSTAKSGAKSGMFSVGKSQIDMDV